MVRTILAILGIWVLISIPAGIAAGKFADYSNGTPRSVKSCASEAC